MGFLPYGLLPSRLVKANMSGGFATHEIIGFLPPPGWGAGPSWQTCGPSRCRRGCGAALGAPAPAGALRPLVQAVFGQAILVQSDDYHWKVVSLVVRSLCACVLLGSIHFSINSVLDISIALQR